MWSRLDAARRPSLLVALVIAGACDADNLFSPHRHPPTNMSRAGAPGSSIDLAAAPNSTTQIDLSWQDNANGETGWEIHRSTTGGGGTFFFFATIAASTTAYSDRGLQPATEYCYKVRSYKTTGRKTTYGEFSLASCAITLGPPPAPVEVRAAPLGYGSIDVRWTLIGSSTTAVRVERAATAAGPWASATTISYSATTYQDQGRPLEVLICYRIVAINVYGESPSAATCTATPLAPSDLSAHSADATSIDVSWKDNSSFEDGYAIERAVDGPSITFSEIATVGANVTTVHDATVVSDRRYYYRVRAKRDGGYSSDSPWLPAAAASTAPGAPANVDARPNGSTAADVVWNAGSVTAESFRVERSTAGGRWMTAATTDGSTTWLYDPGLTSEQLVCYRVVAINRVGESAPSASDCTTPPAAPSEVEVVTIDDYTLEVRWKDNSTVEDGFELDFLSYCDPYGCYWEPQWVSIWLPPDIQSYRISALDSFQGIYALKDGGYSDVGSWKGSVSGLGPNALRGPATAKSRRPDNARRKVPAPNMQRHP